MKKKIFISIVLFLFSNLGIGQTNVYHPLPDSNAVWIGTNWTKNGLSTLYYTNYNEFILGDTIIGPYTYHKLYRYESYYCWPCPPPVPPSNYVAQYSGAFRQDIAHKKIYLFKNGIDTLAYNFNLSVGDTLSSTCLINNIMNPYINYVQSIDSVLVGSQYCKRFWISTGGNINYAALIEGVGSTSGAFEYIFPVFESSNDLGCLKVNNQTVYGVNCVLLSVNENVILNDNLLISQNPFSDNTTLSFQFKNAKLKLYNSYGQLVKQINNITEQTFILHRDNLLCGLYYLQITQGNKTFTPKKLIITDN